MNITKACALWSCAAALLAGCSSTPTTPPPEPAPVEKPAEAPPAPAPVVAAPAPAPVKVPEYLDPNSPISAQRSIYFDYDNFTIKPEYRPLIELQGKYLASHSELSIKIEGNADERGSAEYNLALGQKRAQAVLNALKMYGVKDSQMEAVSWGRERPKATGHDEAAWAQNRRSDLAYPAK